MKPSRDVWPFNLEFTVAMAMPVLFWLGVLCGWLGAAGTR